MKKGDKLQKEETTILASAIQLWKTGILCNPSLIDEFYSFKRNPADIENAYDTGVKRVKHAKITTGDELLIAGLLIDGPKDNRDLFQDALQEIAAKVRGNQGTSPLIYVL